MMIFGKNIAALVAALLIAGSVFGQNPVDNTPPANVNGALFFNDNGQIARMNNWLWDKNTGRLMYNGALGGGTYNLDINGAFGCSGQTWLTGGVFLTSTFLPASAGSNLLATNSAGGVYKVTLGTNLTLSNAGVLDATGGGSSFYQTLRQNGTAQTQRGKLNFIPSAQIAWGLTDDSGNDETEVTATLAQNGATNGQVLAWNGTTWAPAAASRTTTASDRSPGADFCVRCVWRARSWRSSCS